MEQRGQLPVSLPHPTPTTSYWQTPSIPIPTHQPQPSLPDQPLDYLIIGSGISGTATSYNLLLRYPNLSILLLEARSACSGATGRNGGHTKAASYRSFLAHESLHGSAEAAKIARLEYANIQATHALARELGIECASTPCHTVDVVYCAKQFEEGKRAIARMREVLGERDPVAEYEILEAEEAAHRYRCEGALGAFVYEAGSLSAYAFTVGLLGVCVGMGLRVITETAAEGMSRDEATGLWTVRTSRGEVRARNVVLATNGYTAHLLPKMQGLIVPLRGQITAQRPGRKLAETPLQTTYSFIYETGYEYMISRPPGTEDAGTIIIGGGLGTLPNQGASEFGVTDDGVMNEELSTYLRDCTARYFGGDWGEDAAEGRIKKEWSGIMGTSADGLPYVGNVQEGLWISASFNGHGMVLCLKCAEALVDMMVSPEKEERLDAWFPKAFRMSDERLGKRFEGRLNMKPPGEAIFDGKETAVP